MDVVEVRCDQIDGVRSEGSHNARATSGSARYGVAKNEDIQSFHNQCGQSKRSRPPTSKARLQ
eukprot:15702293-Heterocapsa_arctica.AAC.1